ncbi:MAG: DUF504 domain-containing protein [Thermodesulfobacteriota bacterium]
MIPIQQLLNRIRWDRAFGEAEFVIGYHDRFQNTLVRVPFQAILGHTTNHRALELLDPEGVVRTVPWHRIREVSRNGEVIWQRPPQSDPQARDGD